MTELFKGQLDMHPNGYLKVEPGSTRTNIPGVFASGDVADFTYRQAVTAAGTAAWRRSTPSGFWPLITESWRASSTPAPSSAC